ncbi:DUF6896 domain-containing protein [Streptomyces sp. NPDC091279]|uniref:DUF6896 domain-containing protein n=1 Tax=unclassified Streptomyces TaxID=2593676 RepID=UPI003818A585
MSQPPEAAACVRSFLRSREAIGTELAGTFPQFDSLEHVWEAVRAGELDRRARSATGFSYAVHGYGCRMTAPDGTEIDVDLLPDGSEVFDSWRLEVFARSVGASPTPPRDALIQACRDLVRQNILHEPHPEWFRIIKQ